MNLSSEEFIQRLRDQEPKALELIINTYHEALFKGALKQGLAVDQAEEVIQGTWVSFLSAIGNFQGKSHIRTFIFGIMYNKIKELWRSNKKYTTDFDDSHLEQIFNDGGNYIVSPLAPDSWLESKEFSTVLNEELELIPHNQKMAFFLKEIEGEKTEDICNILNVSSTNLGVLIYRAKQNLRVRIERRFSREGSNKNG